MLSKTTNRILTIGAVLSILALGACTKLCNSGYEGRRCNVLVTSKFLGYWSAVDTPGNLIYTDTINQGPVLGDITLSSAFAAHHFNHAINASVNASALTIPYQQPDSGGNFVQGTGTISGNDNQIALTYQIINVADSVTSVYSGTWTRQN